MNRHSPEEIETMLKFVVGVCLSLTLTGTIFTVLYSLIFVTQPLGQSAPNDEKFFQLIIQLQPF